MHCAWQVKYALSLVRPELSHLVPPGIPEVDRLRAELRRVRASHTLPGIMSFAFTDQACQLLISLFVAIPFI